MNELESTLTALCGENFFPFKKKIRWATFTPHTCTSQVVTKTDRSRGDHVGPFFILLNVETPPNESFVFAQVEH